MVEKINQIQTEYIEKISAASSLEELDRLFLELFGKSGVITLLPKEFASQPKEDLQKIGPAFNKAKSRLEAEIERARERVREESYKKLDSEDIDLNDVIPESKASRESNDSMDPRRRGDDKGRHGHLHPLTQFEREIVSIFGELGFQRFDAPLIDTDYNNFEVLNIPEEHPARDLWDTLYIDTKNTGSENGKLLLRTHTSNAQIRILKSMKPPIRSMVIGDVFRYENLDARHEHTFNQFEIVLVDKSLNMTHLQYLSEYFFKKIFGQDIKVRMRPKYYPFVEPTAGIDAQCIFCKGAGCRICGEGWIELAGAGMIHPQVLRNGGIDPDEYTGIAWGTGLERILMVKLGIEDVRLFRNGDLRFLEKF